MGDVIQPPRGGLRGERDQQAYADGKFALKGALPAARPKSGRVTWAGGGTLTRPLRSADASYRALARDRGGADGSYGLTVTGAELGQMKIATSRGPAMVPGWLFTLDGYDTPLKQSAAVASALPRPPIRRAVDVPGLPLDRLTRISADGRSVTVVALHGVCDDGPLVDVRETSGSVVLTASVEDDAKDRGLCTAQGKLEQVTVELARPVGDRVLLDGITGRPVPFKPRYGPSPSWSQLD
ncbi:hypothetical protein [Streptomyces sp. NPDC052225]|uniref:hypothetical protein n=1 Tax=Streptomyces sp. NPDC052225 TaxID=3154949 RepID=UPI003427022B